MSTRAQTEIDTLAAPAADGGILVWPEGRTLPAMMEQNRRLRRSRRFMLLDRPASEWSDGDGEDGPVVLCGHQPDFFHAGVWAKGLVASALARRTGGQARFLIVDSDVPRRIGFDWPDTGGANYRLRRSFAAATDWRSYEHLADPDAIGFAAMFNAVKLGSSGEPPEPLVAFREGFLGKPERLDSPLGYVDRWVAGLRSVDRMLGPASPFFVRTSELFSTHDQTRNRSAPAFVSHLILHAREFATAYNRALTTYRLRRGIKGRRHPIPDLAVEGDGVELPFWVLSADRPRERLVVQCRNDQEVALYAGAGGRTSLGREELFRDPAATLAGALGDRRIRPRALVQTMYVRLFCCDLFIHGIGGAKYDQITDEIIRSFFGIEPPDFACVSATRWLPLRRFDVTEAEWHGAHLSHRDLRYNPQRYLGSTRSASGLDDLLSERERAINDSVRLKRERPKARTARRSAFDRIRRANAGLLQAAPELLESSAKHLAELTEQLAHNRIAKSREWFFALHPAARLKRLRVALEAQL